MRIAIDYTSAIQQKAGIGRYTRNLVSALAKIDRQTPYVLFSAGRDAQPPAWPGNFSRRELILSDRQMAIIWQRLKLPLPIEVFTGRISLFHSPDFVLPPVAAAIKVLTIHDLSFVRHPECSSPALLKYLVASVPPSIWRADWLLADSANTKDDLVELYTIAPERITVVYAGYDPVFEITPSADDAAIRAQYGIKTPYIFGLGTLQPRKNFTTLIRAYYQLIQEKHIPHQLVIGGNKGWLYENIFDAVQQLNLADRVSFLGFVEDAHLPALYRGADLFAFPSLYEGFGIPILESMGCGTPVVTADNSSLPEVAGDAALLVDARDASALADAMWRVLDDSALRQTMRERGLERVKLFSWEKAAETLRSVYRQALE